MVFCDVLLMKGWTEAQGFECFCEEIGKKVRRATDVLELAGDLRTVIVSWIDTTGTDGWEAKARVLAPFRRLSPRVTFKVGSVRGIRDKELDGGLLERAMREVLRVETPRTLRVVGNGLDGHCHSEDDPAKLRMLAFDVKQDRHLYANSESPERFVEVALSNAVAGSVGWKSVGL